LYLAVSTVLDMISTEQYFGLDCAATTSNVGLDKVYPLWAAYCSTAATQSAWLILVRIPFMGVQKVTPCSRYGSWNCSVGDRVGEPVVGERVVGERVGEPVVGEPVVGERVVGEEVGSNV
jgi:hypothetical protein